MANEIIHFAGQTMTFGTVTRQRCLWCGALIQEYDLSRVAIQEDTRPLEKRGKPIIADELGWWSGLVAVDGRTRYAVPDPEDEKAPDRSCMMLMPEEL